VRLGSHHGSDGGRNRGWGGASEGAWWCRGSVAAAAVIPARGQHDRGNEQTRGCSVRGCGAVG
jgi:hypothetical protein